MCALRDGSWRTMDIIRSVTCAFVVLLTYLPGLECVEWVQTPSNQSVNLGGDVTFLCQVNPATLSIIWNKGSTVLFIDNTSNVADSRLSVSGRYNLHISDIRREDAGVYSCNAITFDTAAVHLTVLLPPGRPVITSNASSSLSQLVENTVISLTCSSTGGIPTPEIKWLKNGQQITRVTGTSSPLVISLDRTDDSANYSCVVTNSVNQNSPFMDYRTLSVQYAPHITFEPYTPYNVRLNTPATLKCVVDANPRVSEVEWTRPNKPPIRGSPLLEFNPIKKLDSGSYTCTATNTVGGTPQTRSQSNIVNVIYAPTVTTQSVIEAVEGGSVNMTCEVDANPPAYDVRWQKADGSININDQNFVFRATKRDAGNYTCTARSHLQPSGQAVEEVSAKGYTTVYVLYQPGQASINPTTAVLVGQTVKLTCTVDDPGYPLPSYAWRKMGDGRVLQNTSSPILTIPSAQLSDNGNYSCLPSNRMGQGSPAMILVEVNAAPLFTQSSPARLTVPISQSNLQLQHTITGRPLPTVTWLKDSQPLSEMKDLYDIATTSSLVDFKYTVSTTVSFIGSDRERNSLKISDIGNYSCRAEASGTSPATQMIQLSIEFSPQTEAESRVAVDVSETAELVCRAQANPAPQFFWYRDGGVVSPSPRILISQTESGRVTYEGRLRIHDVNDNDFGDYTCEMNNTKGYSRKTVKLSRKSRPEPPTDLSSDRRTWESVRLHWTAGFNGGFAQAFFIVLNSVHGEKVVEVYPPSATTFNVSRLMPHTSYTFYVFGRNQLGRGSNSEGFTAQTIVLGFPPLPETPKFVVEEQQIKVPNNLNNSYCLRVDVSIDSGRTWNIQEQCASAVEGVISLALSSATNVNVSVCLQYRPEVCGDPFISDIDQAQTPDLTETEVIIIGCVCAGVLIILLIVLIIVLCRRQRKKNNFPSQTDPHSPRVIHPVNGISQPKPLPRGFDNPGMLPVDIGLSSHSNHRSHSNQGTLTRTNNHPGTNNNNMSDPSEITSPYGATLGSGNGYPIAYRPADINPLETSYDSQYYDNRYEFEMNRRNANSNGDPYYDKQGDLSFVGTPSPQTPTKDPQQFIHVPEEPRKGEGGSVGSGNESGYSTPDPAKPKKGWRLKQPVMSLRLRILKAGKHKGLQVNPELVPYHHDPPGHTCGLPCCSEDLQIQLRVRSRPKSCIAFQGFEEVQQNFTLNNRRQRGRPLFENGFISVQQPRETTRAAIPEFGSVRQPSERVGRKNFLKGREITLPESDDPDAMQRLYMGDMNTSESEDILDVGPESDIEYYMTATAPDGIHQGAPNDPEGPQRKQIYQWDLMLDLKYAPNDSKSEDGSSNYYEVLHYPDSTSTPSFHDNNVDQKQTQGQLKKNDKKILKPRNRRPLPVPVPQVPLKQVTFQMDAPKSSSIGDSSGSSYLSSESSHTSNKFNTYSSVYSVSSMLNNRYTSRHKYMSLDRTALRKGKHVDAREINFNQDWVNRQTCDQVASVLKNKEKEDIVSEIVQSEAPTDQKDDKENDDDEDVEIEHSRFKNLKPDADIIGKEKKQMEPDEEATSVDNPITLIL